MAFCILTSVVEWLSRNEHTPINFGADLGWRFGILGAYLVLGNSFLIIYTNPRQLWKDVLSDIQLFKDIILPIIVVAIVNFLIEYPLHGRGFIHQLLHFGIEAIIVLMSYWSIIVFEYTKMERELQNYQAFWDDLSKEINNAKSQLVGIHTSDLRKMFVPAGLKYFHRTAFHFEKLKAKNPSLKFSRIFLINDKIHDNPKYTWVNGARIKPDLLTPFEQQFQLYIELHKEYGIELRFLTKKKLHDLLVEQKNDTSISDDVKQILNEICPCDGKCKNLKTRRLDCLIIDSTPFNTAPSTTRGLEFVKEDSIASITQKLYTSVLADKNSLFS